MPRFPSYIPFAVETIFKSMLVAIFVQIIHTLNSRDRIQKYAATIRLDTSPVAFTKSMGQAVPFSISIVNQLGSVHHFPDHPQPKTHTRTDLVPEFDLSIPTAGDNLGGFMRMP